MMISLFLLSTNAVVAMPADNPALPCEGIRVIEASTADQPLPFASLREQAKVMTTVRSATGQRVQREVNVTNVRSLAGFSSCRFVYTAQIDLACYIGTTLSETDTDAIAAKLISTAESVGHCLTNRSLVRSESEPGSTPSINFGAGPRQQFWQISMVPTDADPSRIQPEILVLGPAPVTTPQRPAPRARRKKR
jgi:hypothetical protein